MMENIDIMYTQDGSIGLYDKTVGDIYHSSYGAYWEAVNKFVSNACFERLLGQDEIRILDVCYGIGYNTKAALTRLNGCGSKVVIDAIEFNQNLVLLSAILKDTHTDNDVLTRVFEEVTREFQDVHTDRIDMDAAIMDFYNNPKFKPYLQAKNKRFRLFTPPNILKSILHNIYYRYISTNSKNTPQDHIFNDFYINYHIDDARCVVQNLENHYDVIFLDAFTPSKQPVLWTYEFFGQLKRLMKPNSVLVTYSNSCAVRNALILHGFYVGKTFIQAENLKKNSNGNKSFGTIASMDKNLIKYLLDEYDFGLINSNAGIIYSDKDLNADSGQILLERNVLAQALKLQSSSEYIKKHKKAVAICMT